MSASTTLLAVMGQAQRALAWAACGDEESCRAGSETEQEAHAARDALATALRAHGWEMCDRCGNWQEATALGRVRLHNVQIVPQCDDCREMAALLHDALFAPEADA